MNNLIDYIIGHTVSNQKYYGEKKDESMANVEFFNVSLKNNPDKDVLIKHISEHKGVFCDIDILDGKEHNYIDIRGWIGDQGLALRLMGLGKLLDLWYLLTPTAMGFTGNVGKQMAEIWMISIIVPKNKDNEGK